MRILAIDPGPVESAYVVIDSATQGPVRVAKAPNAEVLGMLHADLPDLDFGAIEMVTSYGMAVGAEVFETCVWIGRFLQVSGDLLRRVPRREVKLHLCEDSRAKDTNIRQALVDRFAPGQPNHGKGTKADPGWFHGFHSDVWAAYALAVLVADRQMGRERP